MIKMINIVAATERGAFEYHVRSYRHDFVYDERARTLFVPVDFDFSVTLTNISVLEITSTQIKLLGYSQIESGTGVCPTAYHIYIEY